MPRPGQAKDAIFCFMSIALGAACMACRLQWWWQATESRDLETPITFSDHLDDWKHSVKKRLRILTMFKLF